jgi:Family of unknown function (DUF6134)
MIAIRNARGWRTALGGVMLLLAPLSIAHAQQWQFQVFLDDSPIGHHHFTLQEQGGERELKTQARFDVRVLFINAYRYVHDATERWSGNCLSALTARTDDNGKALTVNATRQDGVLQVQASGARATHDGCVMSFAYWNPALLKQTRLLNSQTGQYENVSITALGEEVIQVRGAPLSAKRYRINGSKHPIELWYGPGEHWVALQSTLESGRKLRYQIK